MPNSAAKLFYTLMTWFGIAMLGIAIILLAINSASLIDGEIAEGTTYEYVNLGNENGTSRYPNVKFTAANGNDYFFIDTTESAMNRQQRRFDVLYDPNEPSKAMVYNKMDVFGMPIIMTITGFGALIFGLLTRRAAKKNQWEEDV